MSDFDWSRENGNVVLRAYGSIAVHENPYGDVVIRQERDALEEDDSWVVIPVQDAELVAHALLKKAAEIKQEWQSRQTLPALPAPTDRTAAERQRRYRDKHRNERTVTGDRDVTLFPAD